MAWEGAGIEDGPKHAEGRRGVVGGGPWYEVAKAVWVDRAWCGWEDEVHHSDGGRWIREEVRKCSRAGMYGARCREKLVEVRKGHRAHYMRGSESLPGRGYRLRTKGQTDTRTALRGCLDSPQTRRQSPTLSMKRHGLPSQRRREQGLLIDSPSNRSRFACHLGTRTH